jgi:single-strand DNA-binding protein
MTVAEITIIGRLGRDPEMRYLPSGKAVTNFNIATDREWKDASGQKVKETTWFKIATFDKQAENCHEYLKKGNQVYIKGRLNVDSATGGPKIWTRQDGSAGSNFDVTAHEVKFLSNKQNGEGGSAPSEPYGESTPDAGANTDSDGFPL